MLPYVHPVLAALVLAFLGYVASLAIRAQNDRRARAALLARHAVLAPWMFGGMLAMWAGGLVMSWATRPAADVATSGHFRIGIALVAALGAGALSSRWMKHRAVRSMHPWFGALALLLAAAQVFFGLQILP